MALLPTSMLHHLRSLPRAASRFRITNPARCVFTHPPRKLSFSPPPPARRRFEPVAPKPTPTFNSTKPAPNANANPHPKPTRTPIPKPKPEHTRHTVARRPTNRHIPFDHVYVVDPETNKLSPTKHALEELLATRERRVVELVASTPEPIVRVTTRSEIEARYKEMKRAVKRGARVGEESKEVHLSWGVGQADLEHKLRKARRDLEKGYRVVVVVAFKNRRRPSSREHMVAFADEVSQALGEVGKEWKEREYTQRSMTLSFQKADLDDVS